MAFVQIEDQSNAIELILFPDSFSENSDKLAENKPLLFVGKVNIREGERSIICDAIRMIDMDKANKTSDGIFLRIPTNANKEDIAKLKKVLKENPGDTPVTVQIPDGEELKTMQLKKGIDLTDDVREGIEGFRVN